MPTHRQSRVHSVSRANSFRASSVTADQTSGRAIKWRAWGDGATKLPVRHVVVEAIQDEVAGRSQSCLA
jgi:hypothetical protein